MNMPTLTAADIMGRLSDALGDGKLEAALEQANAGMAAKAAELGVTLPDGPAESLDGDRDPGADSAAEWAKSLAEAQALKRAKAAHPAGKGRAVVAERPEPYGTIDEDYGQAENIAEEALRIVSGDRAQAYGAASENSLPRAAKMWSAYLGREVSGRDVANLMMLLKLAREAHAPKRDNHADIIGYGILAEQLPAA